MQYSVLKLRGRMQERLVQYTNYNDKATVITLFEELTAIHLFLL